MSEKLSYLKNNIKVEDSKLVYKPPGHDKYIDLIEYLDAVDRAIKGIQQNIQALNNFVK